MTLQTNYQRLQSNLASSSFIEQTENIVFLSSSGIGKTYLATLLGIENSRNKRSTYLLNGIF